MQRIEENGITVSTFYGWLKKEKKLTASRQPFNKVPIPHNDMQREQTIILERHGFRIHLPQGFYSEDVKHLLEVLERVHVH